MLDFVFYGFASLAVISAIFVVTSTNAVHSVLFLILVFSFSAGVLLLLNAEFLAIVYVVVYVGAIAVLFLFVVMMLNIRMSELTAKTKNYYPLGVLVGLILFLEMYFIVNSNLPSLTTASIDDRYVRWSDILQYTSNVEVLSEVLYTYYVYFFILAGMVLFVAMVGAIVLTLHHKTDVKRQEIYQQVARDYANSIVKVNLKKQ